MITTGTRVKLDTRPSVRSCFYFSLVQTVIFFSKRSDIYYWQVESNFTLDMILVLTSIFFLWKQPLAKNLFCISTMKGINYKMSTLCKTAIFRTLLLSSRTFLRKNNGFLPAKGNRSIQRSNPRKQYVSQRIRGLITSQLIMITDIITCWPCQYCPPK